MKIHDRQWSAILLQSHDLLDSSGFGLAAALSRLALDSIPTLRRVSPLKISNNFDIYCYIAMAVYSLSNDFLGSGRVDQIWDVLDFIFCRVPRTILRSFLQRNFWSMKAAWERLVSPNLWMSRTDRFKRLFKNLMEIGIRNNWIDSYRMDLYLDYPEIVETLLDKGCRLDTYALYSSAVWDITTGRIYFSPIIEALENRNFECARLLIEYCDVNRVMSELNSHYMQFSAAQRTFASSSRAFGTTMSSTPRRWTCS